MVPFPLLTPQTLLWTRLPTVARLNARGPQGRSVLQGSTLDGSRAFRSGTTPPSGGGECRGLPAETRGDRAPMVPFPLLTPQTLLWTRLPTVARLNARGPQGRSVLQGSTLDGSRAFRSGTTPPCTVWPRTVMRGGLRKVTSGHNSVPELARRTEPSPRLPRLAANASLSGQRKVKGVSRGDIGNRRCPTSPFVPAGEHRHPPRRRRRPLCTLTSSVKSPPPASRCIGGRSAVC